MVIYIRFVCKQRPIDLGTLTVPVISRREKYDLIIWGRSWHFKSCWFPESGLWLNFEEMCFGLVGKIRKWSQLSICREWQQVRPWSWKCKPSVGSELPVDKPTVGCGSEHSGQDLPHNMVLHSFCLGLLMLGWLWMPAGFVLWDLQPG